MEFKGYVHVNVPSPVKQMPKNRRKGMLLSHSNNCPRIGTRGSGMLCKDYRHDTKYFGT